jgi:hypothetical protein
MSYLYVFLSAHTLQAQLENEHVLLISTDILNNPLITIVFSQEMLHVLLGQLKPVKNYMDQV